MDRKLIRKWATALCTCAAAVCILSVPVSSLFPDPGFARGLILLTAAILLLAAVFLWLVFYRCPRCGKLLPLGRGGDPGICRNCGESCPKWTPPAEKPGLSAHLF